MDGCLMFYTYTHSTPHGKVFYVGKGTKDRAFSKSDRSIAWRNAVEKFGGYGSLIAAEWKTEEEAFYHEKFLISCFKDLQHPLVNVTSGGRGPNDYCVSEEVRIKKSLKQTGYKHKTVVCPKCGTSGGETSMKRWHFEKCTGAKKFKASVSVNKKRIFLGNFESKEVAKQMVEKYLKELT
jgi:hypothetical protein